MSLVPPLTQVTEDSESHRRTLIESATYRLMCLKHSPVSFVLAFFDGLLGSPVPTALLAKTLNSYSTQGLSSITVAVRCVPRTTSGTGTKQNTHILWDEPPREPARPPAHSHKQDAQHGSLRLSEIIGSVGKIQKLGLSTGAVKAEIKITPYSSNYTVQSRVKWSRDIMRINT